MRIKKYQNWKLATTYRPNTSNHKRQSISNIFTVSQLLETPKKVHFQQDEHQYLLTDSKAINDTFDFNQSLLIKKDIHLKNFTKPLSQAEREQTIKNKIKQRVKEKLYHQNKNISSSIKSFHKQQSPQKFPIKNLNSRKRQPIQRCVYIKGNSVGFKFNESKKQLRSTSVKTPLSNFSRKDKFFHNDQVQERLMKKNFSQRLYSVQIRRNLSSSVGARQRKITSELPNKNSLKQIEPWQIDDWIQPFQF